jgi:hypothetical protein
VLLAYQAVGSLTMTVSFVRGHRIAAPIRGPQGEARSTPSSTNDDSDDQADDWDDCDSWPPDDLDLELDDEPEPEPGDFWMPEDDDE